MVRRRVRASKTWHRFSTFCQARTGPSSSHPESLTTNTMSKRVLCPSSALLRSLGARAPLQSCLQRHQQVVGKRAFRLSPRSLEVGDRSFRGQLYESTARRLKAQREAEARHAEMTPISAFARNAAFTFCKNPLAAEKT